MLTDLEALLQNQKEFESSYHKVLDLAKEMAVTIESLQEKIKVLENENLLLSLGSTPPKNVVYYKAPSNWRQHQLTWDQWMLVIPEDEAEAFGCKYYTWYIAEEMFYDSWEEYREFLLDQLQLVLVEV